MNVPTEASGAGRRRWKLVLVAIAVLALGVVVAYAIRTYQLRLINEEFAREHAAKLAAVVPDPNVKVTPAPGAMVTWNAAREASVVSGAARFVVPKGAGDFSVQGASFIARGPGGVFTVSTIAVTVDDGWVGIYGFDGSMISVVNPGGHWGVMDEALDALRAATARPPSP